MYANTKTIVIPLLIICIAFVTTLVAHAQTSTPSEQSEVRKELRQEVREERRTALSEATQKRIINLAANISNRIDAVVKRLQNITDRLESRIEKLSARGVDTSTALVELEIARNTLANISAQMNSIDKIVYDSTTSETPREDWLEIKTLLRSVHKNLISAREALRNTVATLNEAVVNAELGRGASEAVSTEVAASTTDVELAE